MFHMPNTADAQFVYTNVTLSKYSMLFYRS